MDRLVPAHPALREDLAAYVAFAFADFGKIAVVWERNERVGFHLRAVFLRKEILNDKLAWLHLAYLLLGHASLATCPHLGVQHILCVLTHAAEVCSPALAFLLLPHANDASVKRFASKSRRRFGKQARKVRCCFGAQARIAAPLLSGSADISELATHLP